MSVGVLDPIQKELRNFLSLSVSRPRNLTPESAEAELLRSATFLLKNFPPSRDAVLDIFARLINSFVDSYFSSLVAQNPAKKSRTEASGSMQAINEVLMDLISQNPKGWAPIISAWSLKLLGQLSTEHASQIRNKEVSSGLDMKRGLNDIVQLWLSCQPTRMLADLTIQCLNELSAAETDSCINALLETSLDHGPDFDWVVAHIGGCVAHTMATRVLSCGLQEYANMSIDRRSCSSKLQSVVGILTHLASSHSVNTHQAVTDLFKWSLGDNSSQAVAVVPYLLSLSALSSDLVNIVTGEVVSCIDDAAIRSLARQSSTWFPRFFTDPNEVVALVVRHLLRTSHNGFQAVALLLTRGADQPEVVPGVALFCSKILERLLEELAEEVRSAGRPGTTDIPFLRSLETRVDSLCQLLGSADSWQCAALIKIVSLMTIFCSPNVSRQVLTFVLQRVEGHPLVLHLVRSVQAAYPNVVVDSVHDALESSRIHLENVLKNLLSFLNLEREHPELVTVANHCTFHAAVRQNLHLFTRLLALDGSIPHLACLSLEHVPLPANLNVKLVSSFGHAVVPHFFSVLARRNQQISERLSDIRAVQAVMVSLSKQPSGQALVLRLLMKGSFSKEWKHLFGAEAQKEVKNHRSRTSLLEQNMNFTSSVTVPQRHSSVFHAGIIGNGIRKKEADPQNTYSDPDLTRSNVNALMDTLLKCCHSIGQGMVQLSLLLVEVVSPDVMFNGLPWPDEDFTKVTVERDLQIRRFVSDHDYIWDFFELLALHRPSFCYCSVLIRGLLAVLISHWANCQEKTASDNKSQFQMTYRLLGLMALGQLLPPPLCYLPELLPHVTPHEVYVLLRDVWAFMRDNVPSPALFGENMWRDFSSYTMDPRYTERLRLILLANIETLGELYPRFFPQNPK